MKLTNGTKLNPQKQKPSRQSPSRSAARPAPSRLPPSAPTAAPARLPPPIRLSPLPFPIRLSDSKRQRHKEKIVFVNKVRLIGRGKGGMKGKGNKQGKKGSAPASKQDHVDAASKGSVDAPNKGSAAPFSEQDHVDAKGHSMHLIKVQRLQLVNKIITFVLQRITWQLLSMKNVMMGCLGLLLKWEHGFT